MLKKLCLFIGTLCLCVNFGAFAEDDFYDVMDIEEITPENAEEVSANALENYDTEGSLFEKITNLEQDKVLMQLEAERARMDLELDELNAKKMKMQMELDELAGRADQKQQELEAVNAQLAAQTEELKRKVEELANREYTVVEAPVVKQEYVQEEVVEKKPSATPITKKYDLINIVGLGNQLQATIRDLATGQNKRVSVGKKVDGYTVKSISLNDGIVFEKDGHSENLSTGI